MKTFDSPLRLAWYVLAVLLAVFTYFFGLDSAHIPKNPDEFPYLHITRLTATSGHLLPLQSEMPDMRNTKPPLLFWQGIASTNWGKNWTLWHLRYPSVLYTLLTALLTFLLAWKLSHQMETGFVACLAFLAFFSTYHYGRPLLTSAPEVFWLFLPFFVLLYWQPASFESRFLVPLLLGLGIGVGLLYKSFALALPVSIGLTWWYLHRRGYRLTMFLVRDVWKIAVLTIISLALFSLWFVLDPDPQAVLKEFVLGENVGKFDPKSGGYLARFLWGGSSIWILALGYPLNAGLLAFPVSAVFFIAYKNRAQLGESEKLLWIWVVVLFFVFSLPSRRSVRYILPAMPALAVLCALGWHRISRKAFVASLVVSAAAVALMAYLALRLELGVGGARFYTLAYWVILTGAGALILLALLVPRFTRPSVNTAVLLVFLSFTAFLRPFDAPLGNYDPDVQSLLKGRDVWVPTTLRAKEEGYRFLLPGANIHAYRYDPSLSVGALSAKYPLFAITLPMNVTNFEGGKVLGQRLVLGSRHNSAQIKEMLRGRVFEHLFLRELLIEGAGIGTNTASILKN